MPTLTYKKFFTFTLLLAFSANIASAALRLNLAPVLETSTIKTVTDPITKEPVLIETKVIPVDSSKIYQPAATKASQNLPTSAKIEILEIKKSPSVAYTPNSLNAKSVTITDPISAGLIYLVSSQAADGSWSQNNKLKFQTTAAVAKLLNELNQKVGASSTEQILIDTILPKALDSLRFSFPENSDYLADKISGLTPAGDNLTASMDYLAAQINDSSLAFGQKKNFGADIITTSKILESLTATNYQDPGDDPQYTLKAALLYLLNAQNPDGGWPEVKGESSSLYATNLVLHALYPYRTTVIQGMLNGDIVIPTRVSLGFNYLKNYQYYFDGSWQGNLLYSAMSFDNFISYGVDPNYKQKGLDYLKNSQNPDGSFSNPANNFYTAKSIEALAKPDINTSNIQNPITVPDPNATLWVTVRNDGYLTSNPLNLSASPSAFTLKIDDQNIPLDFGGLLPAITFEPNSEVIFEIHFNQYLIGQHSVKFKSDYAGPEFWKNNNEKSVDLAFGTPQFSGPTPPPWIGASTDSDSGAITLRWQQSSDPTRDHYALFISSASGQYDLNSPLYVFPPGNYSGITFDIYPAFYNIPLYFIIVSYDSSGNHGNYSPETWAVAYSNPESYRGTLAGRVYNTSNPAQSVPNAEINFFLLTSFYSDLSGNYSLNYYPGFYLTTLSQPNFYQANVEKVQITAQSNSARDFPMLPRASGVYPPSLTGLRASPGNNQITLNWDPYTPPSDFKQFDIVRSNNYFYSMGTNTATIATTTNPAATSFTDTRVINGLNYYYAVYAENASGGVSNQNAIGPIQPSLNPTMSNITALQSGGDILLTYDLSDPIGNPSLVSFEYWDGSSWHDASSTIGEGVQSPGPSKTGTWHAKQDFPEFDGQIKIRVKATQGSSQIFGESLPFNLDTKNPLPPSVYSLPPTTALFQRTIGGLKESLTSIKTDGVEVVPQSSGASWSYNATLKQGQNFFSFTAVDPFDNESSPTAASINYDPNFFICGDLNGDESVNVIDVAGLVNVLFRGYAFPPHPARMDVNNDGSYNVVDLANLVNYVFKGGKALTCPAG